MLPVNDGRHLKGFFSPNESAPADIDPDDFVFENQNVNTTFVRFYHIVSDFTIPNTVMTIAVSVSFQINGSFKISNC